MAKSSFNFYEDIANKTNSLTLVGLGNFGDHFTQEQRFGTNRHNLGAMLLNFIAKQTGLQWKVHTQETTFRFVQVPFSTTNHTLNLITFAGFINQSGENLLPFLIQTKILHKNLIICVDNINLPFGTYKLSNHIPNIQHNGLNNIKEQLKSKQIKVLQIGVDRHQPVSDWVLTNFTSSQLNRLQAEIFPQLWKKLQPLAQHWPKIKDPISFFYQSKTHLPLQKPHLAVIGGQWGDEGKGKIVDYCAYQFNYSTIARFGGGNNAGHTIYFGQTKKHFSLLPVTTIDSQKLAIIGRNCLLDLEHLVKELTSLTKDQKQINLQISPHCHLVMPYHLLLDQLQEVEDRSHQPIGTTKKGIGPCLEDKVGRFGIQLQDLFDLDHFRQKLSPILKSKNRLLTQVYGKTALDLSTIVDNLYQLFLKIKQYVTPVWHLGSANNQTTILFEGAQGTLLDVNFGTYPFVTSSNTLTWAIGNSFPLAFPQTKLLGVFKAYSSRVGSGPFPTEFAADSKIANHFVTHGHEYGVVTKRKRRVGWFDAVLSKYACQINHFDQLAITLLDVLTGCEEVKICVGYSQNQQTFTNLDKSFVWNQPFNCQYLTLPGWNQPITEITRYQDLPINAQKYLEKISELLNLPISLVSVGPKRSQTFTVGKILSDQ